MWTTVLVLAIALNLEPNRLGIIGLLFLRPHPIRQLLVFLCCSFLTSSTAGLIVLYLVYRGSILKGESTGAIMQITVGSLALIAATVLFSNVRMPGSKSSQRSAVQSDPSGTHSNPSGEAIPSTGLGLVDNFAKRAGGLINGSSLWFAAAMGVGISLPSVDYIALLLLISSSGEPPRVQVTALFTFLIVANTILLIPIISYALAKDRTIRVLERLRTWVLARSRRDYAVLLAIAGTLMIAVGFSNL